MLVWHDGFQSWSLLCFPANLFKLVWHLKNIFLPQMDIPLCPHLKRKNKLNFPFLGGFGVVGSCFWKFMVAFMRNEGFNDDYFTPAFLFMFSFSLFLLTFARAFQSLLLVLGSAHLTKHLWGSCMIFNLLKFHSYKIVLGY